MSELLIVKTSLSLSCSAQQLHVRSRLDHRQTIGGSDYQRPSSPLLLRPPPAVQFHAFSTSFVPVESRRLSRLTGCRGWELVLPLQPSRPAAPALIGNSPRLPSGLLSSVLTCKTARLSCLSGPAGQLLATISGLCYMQQNYLVVSVCHTVIFDSFQAAENLSASISVRWAGGGGSCSQGLAGQDLPTQTEMDIIHVLHHVASSLFPLFVSLMFYIFYQFFVATVTRQESVSDRSANPQTYMWRYL